MSVAAPLSAALPGPCPELVEAGAVVGVVAGALAAKGDELVVRIAHEGRHLLYQPPYLVRNHGDVKAPCLAAKLQAACHKLINVNGVGAVAIQQLEEGPG